MSYNYKKKNDILNFHKICLYEAPHPTPSARNLNVIFKLIKLIVKTNNFLRTFVRTCTVQKKKI